MTEINKEIEEMAEVIKSVQDSQVFHDGEADRKQIATALHKAGYRKQSDTVKEFAEKINVEANKPNIGETEEEWDNNEAFKDGLRHAIELSAQFGVKED